MPLKEHQHRKVYRDRRLIAKPEDRLYDYTGKQLREHFVAPAESGRLFSQTMRTRNRPPNVCARS